MASKVKITPEVALRNKEAKTKLREQERVAKAKAQLAKLKKDARDSVAKAEKEVEEKKTKLEQSALAKIAKKRKSYEKKVALIQEKMSKIPKASRNFTEAELVEAAIAKCVQKQERAHKEMIQTISRLGAAPTIKPEPAARRSTAGEVIDLTD